LANLPPAHSKGNQLIEPPAFVYNPQTAQRHQHRGSKNTPLGIFSQNIRTSKPVNGLAIKNCFAKCLFAGEIKNTGPCNRWLSNGEPRTHRSSPQSNFGVVTCNHGLFARWSLLSLPISSLSDTDWKPRCPRQDNGHIYKK